MYSCASIWQYSCSTPSMDLWSLIHMCSAGELLQNWHASSNTVLCASVLPFLTCPLIAILQACLLETFHVWQKWHFSVQKQIWEIFTLLNHYVGARDHLRQTLPNYFFLSSPLSSVSHFSHNHHLLPILVHDSCFTHLNVIILFLLFLLSYDLCHYYQVPFLLLVFPLPLKILSPELMFRRLHSSHAAFAVGQKEF